jgi:aminocarboxymuconate-semialdehyde decarboxylase
MNLKFLVEQFGADRVVIGSDYPFDMGAVDPIGAVAEAGLSEAARKQIEGATAARFLGL